jgi:uncharacterized OsmC-like protein
MALVDRPKLRSNHERVVARLTADDAFGLMRPQVTARLVRDVSVESRFVQYERDFTFLGDEAEDRGGFETGPSPMRYFLSGIGFCLLGWWAKGSALLDLEVNALEVTLRTFLDMRGEHGIEGVPPYPQYLVLDITVSSQAPPEKILEMLDWGRHHCPLSNLVGSAIPLHERVVLDGTTIRDTVPASAA